MNDLPENVKQALLTISLYCDEIPHCSECKLMGPFGCPIGGLANYYTMSHLCNKEESK